jgi:predicted phosphodiesterase
MRYGIFSDVHSNIEALEAVIKAYKKEKIDTYLCAGDVVGYAANPSECIQLVKEVSSFTVAGNHDWAVIDLFSIDYFNSEAKRALVWTKKIVTEEDSYYLRSLKLIYKNDDLTLVHGSLYQPQYFHYITDIESAEESFRLLENNICFIGHLHVSGVFVKDNQGEIYYYEPEYIQLKLENKYIINVGSVGQPRDGNPFACYCIFDTEKKEIWIKRQPYDIDSTYKKIIKAGLPLFLAQRLYWGR